MKLINIKIINVKSHTGSLDIKSLNYIVGSNWSGKTTWTDAIRLLLIGFLPENGKRNQDTWRLAGVGRVMEVSGTFDDGTTIWRRWSLDGDAVKYKESPMPAWLGDGEAFIVMLNAEKYFALSERERTNYVAANCPSGKMKSWNETVESIVAKLTEQFPSEVVTVDRQYLADAVINAGLKADMEFLTQAIEDCKGAESDARAEVVKMEKTVQGLSALRTQDAQTANPVALEAKRAALTAELQTLNMDVAARREVAKAVAGQRARRQELTRTLGRKPELEGRKTDHELRIDAMEHDLERHPVISDADLAALTAEDKAAAGEEIAASNRLTMAKLAATSATATIDQRAGLERRAQALRAKLAPMQAELDGIQSVTPEMLATLRADDRSVSLALEKAKNEAVHVAEAIATNDAELLALDGMTACPFCEAEGTGWKVRVTSKITGTLRGLRVKADQLAEHREKLGEALRNLAERLDKATVASNRRAELTAAMAPIQRELDGLAGQLKAPAPDLTAIKAAEVLHAEAHNQAMVKATMCADALTTAQNLAANRAGIVEAIATAKTELATVTVSLAELKGAQDELDRIPEPNPAAEAAQIEAEAAVGTKQAEIENVENALNLARGRENDLRRLAQAETSRDAAKVDQAVAKAAAELFRDAQRAAVAAVFGPLLVIANRIFGGVLKSPIDYNADTGEIGTWRDGAWVGHKTFSGTEKALCYAAIQAALASQSPMRLMIVDELGRLDDTHAAELKRYVKSAVKENLIDQFVGIDTRTGFYRAGADETCQVIEVV
jgi:DNA repair exonuclease SbcCD ATPase subunit